jgi:prepilin-type N-terminal cleavage/methylation domain-containing protein
MASAASNCADSRGFSLIEVAMATSLMAILALGVAQLFAVGALANLRAKNQTSLSLLAVQKMEQLKALQWGFDQGPDALGLAMSDLATDLSQCRWTSSPEHCATMNAMIPAAGNGLNPSPDGTLDANTAGYVDYLDRNGNWMGNGAVMPPAAHYARRWAIEPLPTNPHNTLVLQVRVLTREAAGANAVAARIGGVTLVSVKTRKAS